MKLVREIPSSLRENPADVAAGLARATAGAVPVAGPFLAELVSRVIPNQRAERVISYMAKLRDRLSRLEVQITELQADQLTPEQIALFQEGAHAASGATSDERVAHIAEVVAAGLTASEVAAADQRRILKLLQELSDDEVVMLCYYSGEFDEEWEERHELTLDWTARYQSQRNDDVGVGPDEEELDALSRYRDRRLVSLGLLDEKKSSYTLSDMGHVLLGRLGLLEFGAS